MDAVARAAGQRKAAGTALFLILRHTGMRRASVGKASGSTVWGCGRFGGSKVARSGYVPLPSAVARYLAEYVDQVLGHALDRSPGS